MNVLTVQNWSEHYRMMTDEQLKTEKQLVDVRRIQLREENGNTKPDGWRLFAGHLVKLFNEELIQYVRCRRMDERELLALARSWAIQLEQEYITFGVDGIRAAMRYYVANDDTPQMRFPKVGQIKAACKELKGSPGRELGLREQARREAQMEAEHQALIDAFKVEHPDEWARIQEEAEKRMAAQSGRKAM